MGRDVFVNTGVLLHPIELEPLFRSRSLAIEFRDWVISSQKEFLSRLLPDGQINVQKVWQNEGYEDVDCRGDVYDRLSKVENGRQLFGLLFDLTYAAQSGELRKYFVTSVRLADELLHVWVQYIKAFNTCAGASFPEPIDVLTFGNSRDYDSVPICQPLLCFPEDSLFITRLTKSGEAFAALIGTEPHVFTWADLSY